MRVMDDDDSDDGERKANAATPSWLMIADEMMRGRSRDCMMLLSCSIVPIYSQCISPMMRQDGSSVDVCCDVDVNLHEVDIE